MRKNINLSNQTSGVLPAVSIPLTSVVPGSYTSADITVGKDGRLTHAANGGGGGGSVTAVTATAPIHSSGGTTPNVTVDTATTSNLGVVKPDGTSITVSGGTISAAAVPPTGSAGGDLSGSYPNPGVVKLNGGVVPTSQTYVGTNSSGQLIAASTPTSGINQLTGDVTAGPGTGSQAGTVVATHLTAPLPIAQGGSGTATPAIVAGSNITVSGSWPNQTVNASAPGTGTVTTTGSPASGNLTKFSGATSVTNADLTGDVTSSGTVATTIAANAVTTSKINNSAVTLAKIANAAASSKLLGSGASGVGAAYSELTLGANLSMSGTTLNVTAGGGSGGINPMGAAFTPPPSISTLTWINQGGATATDEPNGLLLQCPTHSGDNLRALVTSSYPATPYTFTICLSHNMSATNFNGQGIIIGDGTKFVTFWLVYSTGLLWAYTTWSSSFTGVSTPSSGLIFAGMQYWLRVNDDGVNFNFSISFNGYDFASLPLVTVARTAYLSSPSKIGVFNNVNNTTYGNSMFIVSWAGI